MVYSAYGADMHEAELIVRVPQLVAHYSKEESVKITEEIHKPSDQNGNLIINSLLCEIPSNQRRNRKTRKSDVENILSKKFDKISIRQTKSEIDQIRGEFSEIFDFFDKFVAADLNIVDGVEIRGLNDKFKLWDKIEKVNVKFESNNSIQQIIDDQSNAYINSKSPILILKSFHDVLMFVNYLQFKSQNLFVDLKILADDKELLEQFRVLKNSETIQRIFIDCQNIQNDEFTESLKTCKKQIIFLNSGKVATSNFEFSWFNDASKISLTEESRTEILRQSIKFQSKSVELSEIVEQNLIDGEILEQLCCIEANVEINAPENFKTFKYFERKLLMDSEELSESEFLTKVNESAAKFFIISDIIGSGKSSTLKSLYEKIIKSSSNWVHLISLKSSHETRNFCAIFAKFLEFQNSVEKLIFESFCERNKIFLLIDGIDDVDENFRFELIKFLESSIFFKVLITTRDERFIDNLRDAQKVSLCPFDDGEKFDFVMRLTDDKIFAADLLEQYKKFKVSFGFPLLMTFIDFSNKNFQNLFKIFEQFHEKNYQKWLRNFNFASLIKQSEKSLNYDQIHLQIALKQKFNLNVLSTIFKGIDWLSFEIEKCFSLCGESLKFHSEIDTKFWIVKFLRASFVDEVFHEDFIEFFFNILKEEDDEVLLEILDNSIADVEVTKNLTKAHGEIIFKYLQKSENEKVLKNLFTQGNFNICIYLLKVMNKFDTFDFLSSINDNEDNCKILAKLKAKSISKNAEKLFEKIVKVSNPISIYERSIYLNE